ncbi:hypothetical protein SAMN05216188_107123 [Lentzea xinjiangensis]|uniref:VOC domain-containing protein n=1 Tax=Lentzea xinjiangensis TaxID=402600 RepID=A0A1H9KUU2_9PSEU|nr:hypothetical protein [Lentzea xinjiangensis]SER02789.1 hypothetical protein SAMN05216188_107123 [Lentzea xinjiangensis]
MDFFAGVLGWTVLAEPGGSFSGWVGDRLAARVVAGDRGWRVFFGGDEPRELRGGSAVGGGRVLHGPWAPRPRGGEPCWVELMAEEPDDGFWVGELGWGVRPAGEGFVLFTSSRQGEPRPVAGRLATSRARGWRVYFAVGDVVAACGRVSALGGRVVVDPVVVPTGLVASVEGPGGGGGCVLLERPEGWGGAWA